MFKITNYYRNANRNYKGIYQPEYLSSKNPQILIAGESVERREPPYTVYGGVNWYSHYGK